MQLWTQFVIAFVEHFGVDAPHAGRSFFDATAEVDLEELAHAQQEATVDELFAALGDKISRGTQEYFAARSWENGAPGCGADVPSLHRSNSLEDFMRFNEEIRSLGDQISIPNIED